MTLGRRVRRGAGTQSSQCASTPGTCSLVWDGLRAPLYCVSIWGECFDGRRRVVISEAHHISVSFVSPARPHRRHIGTPKQHREAQGGRQEAAWRGVALKASFFRSVTTGRSRPSIDVYKPFVHEVWRAIRQRNSQEHFIRWIQ